MANTKIPVELSSTPGIVDNSNATAITIDSSENVQIGSNSFAAPRLQLYAAATGESQIFFGNDGTNGFKDGAIRYFHESHATTSDRRNMTFSTANTERMRINATGVGIGTTSPASTISGSAAVLHLYDGTNNNLASLALQAGTVGSKWEIGALSSNALGFFDDGSERLRIDSSGNVGIGTSSPDAPLHTLVSSGAAFNLFEGSSGKWVFGQTSGGSCQVGGLFGSHSGLVIDTSGNVGIGQTNPSDYYATDLVVSSASEKGITIAATATNVANYLMFADGTTGDEQYRGYLAYTHSGDELTLRSAGFTTFMTGGGTERMRIDTSGNLLVGTTSAVSGNECAILGRGTATTLWLGTSNNNYASAMVADGSGTRNMVFFGSGISTTTQVGSIKITNSSTSYNTTSDYRLKENVDYTWDATTRLKQLKPARFNFLADADTTVDGFLAHEVQDIVPEAISGEKDAVDSEGNPEYQGIDQSKLVPLLVKTIQELEARITALES